MRIRIILLAAGILLGHASYVYAGDDFGVGSDIEPTTPVTGYSVKDSLQEPTPAPIPETVVPTAHAGADLAVLTGTLVVLDASLSTDAGGSVASYSWRQLSGPHVELLSSNTASPSFIAGSSPTTYIFEVTVKDNDGMSAIDLVTVVVQASPTPFPVADAENTAAPTPEAAPEVASSLSIKNILFILLGGALFIALGVGIKKGWNYFSNNATN